MTLTMNDRNTIATYINARHVNQLRVTSRRQVHARTNLLIRGSSFADELSVGMHDDVVSAFGHLVPRE